MKFLTAETADDLDFVRRILHATDFDVVERLVGGLHSFAYLTDNNTVLRFPRNSEVWRTMCREAEIIKKIYPFLKEKFENKIHQTKLCEEEYPFSFLPRIVGKICDNRPENPYAAKYENLKPEQQLDLARQIAVFLDIMHRIDYQKMCVYPLGEKVNNWDKTKEPDYDEKTIRNILSEYSRNIIDLDNYKTENQNLDLALCHNDLSGSNILIRPESADVLGGIVDFADTAVVPKYYDFFSLYKISRKLALDTLNEYNRLTYSMIEPKQIEYLALTYIGYGFYKLQGNSSPYFERLLNSFSE